MSKEIKISKDTYSELAAVIERQGMPASAINELADATIRQSLSSAPLFDKTSEELIESFKEFRGCMQDTTIDDIVADRHRGFR